MIYVSSTGVKNAKISDSVLELSKAGFKKIELTGGTHYYPTYVEELSALKSELGVQYRLHNYFPPPAKAFVLNLASSDESVLSKSRQLVTEALKVSQIFKANKYGLHAGFRINPKVDELGKTIKNINLIPFEIAVANFKKEYETLANEARLHNVELYLENNVFSEANLNSFDSINPFFLTSSSEVVEMKKMFNFSLLLDIAHLKVSCKSLKLDFLTELERMLEHSDYIHLSDNDGTSDSNEEFKKESDLHSILRNQNLKNKTFTLEVYSGVESLKRSYDLLGEVLN